MNMQEDYVSFETAKLLKEKGFDEPCVWAYDPNSASFAKSYHEPKNSELNEYEYSKPTLQMAMAWLREHKMYIMIDRSWSVKNSWQYCICVNDDFDHLIKQDSIPNRTYKEAVEAAIKYCLENLI